MKRQNINNKAQLGATITLVVATIIIFFILTIFFFLTTAVATFKFGKSADIVVAAIDKQQTMISLKALLQTPIEMSIEGKKTKTNLEELIRLNEISHVYDEAIRQEASKILNNFGRCYFFETPTLQLGNSKFREEKSILNLPINSSTSIMVGLAVNSKCLEK